MLNYQSVTVPHGERKTPFGGFQAARSAFHVRLGRRCFPHPQQQCPCSTAASASVTRHAPLGAVTRKEYHGETAVSVVAKPSRVFFKGQWWSWGCWGMLCCCVLLRLLLVGLLGDCGMVLGCHQKHPKLGLVPGEMLNEAATRQGFTYFHLSEVSCFSTAFQKTTGVRRSHPIWANQNHSQIPQIMLFRPLKSWTHVPRIWKYQRWIPKSPIGMVWPPGYRIK